MQKVNQTPTTQDRARAVVQYFIAPVVVGVCILIGQYFLNPKISGKEAQHTELIKAKETAYLNAIDLVNNFYESYEWKMTNGRPRNPTPGPRPTRDEINQVAARLMLVEDDERISTKFLQCVCINPNPILSDVFRNELINLMRNDLYDVKQINHTNNLPVIFNVDTNQDIGPVPN